MSFNVGTAYLDIRGDFSGLNREVASRVTPLANSFGGKFGKALGPVMAQQSKHLRTFTQAAKYGAAGAAGLAVVVGRDVVQAGMKFEKQMSVNSAISEANTKQMAALERQSIKLGQATFYSASEAAEAQGELIKGGLDIKQVLGGGLPAALSLAEAGELELATAAETTVNAMKLFGLEGKQAGSVADMLSTAANRTTADVLDFAMAMKQGGSVTKLAGYDMNETLTTLEALAESGIKNSDAGTSMKTAFIQLLKPTEKQEKLARLLHIHWENQNGELKNAAGLSKELRVATEGMTKAERAKTFATLAGTDGVRTLNALYSETPKELEALEKANARQGTAQDIAAKKMDNLAGEWEQFKGSLETTEIQIYKGIAPALKELAHEGTEAANRIGSVFDNEHLTGSQKVERAIGVLQDELGKIWDRHEMSAHLEDALEFAVDTAVPKMAEHAGELGFEAAKGFARGFTNADFIGKAVMATWLLHFIGGKAPFVAIGKTAGRQFGLTFAGEAAASAASAEVAATTAGAAVAGPGWLGTESRKQRIRLEQAGQRTVAQQTARQALAAQGGVFSTVERDIQSRWKGLGSRLARGAASWGLGGFIVGGIADEVVGGDTGDKLGAAFQGAGVGAAIGNAIEPGIGTAIGAALGGVGGLIIQGLGEDGATLGDKFAEELGERLRKRWPEIQKEIRQMDLGSAGKRQGWEDVPNRPGLQAHLVGASGLRGVRARLRDHLSNVERWDGSEKAIAAIKAEIQKLTQVINAGEKAIANYNHGFDLLKSGAITRMGDISEITQENIATIGQVWKNNPPKWHQAMAESMKASVSAIRSGMKQGVITHEAGLKRIQQLTRNMRLFEGRDPLGLAKGFSEGWVKAGQINSQQIQGEIRELGKMPKGAREAAREAMVGMAKKMESEGRLVKGSASRLNSALTSKFGQTNKQVQQSTARAMAHIAQSAADGATNVGGSLSNIFDNLANALAAVGSSKIPTFSLSTLSTASQYHHAREEMPQKKQTGGFIVPGTGSGDTWKGMVPAGSFVENREAVRRLPFQSGGMVPVALEPGERLHFPAAVNAIGKHVLEARNRAVPRFQTGGLVHPKLDGPDPLRTVGQAAIDKSFTAASKYLRKHSEPKRILDALHALQAQVAIGWPYVYGGGHGSFHGPFDCSGLVSYGLHAADFINTPLSVQQGSGLYTLGASGPGKWLTWGVRGTSGMSAHTMMAVKDPKGKWEYFEAGGSGGGTHSPSGWDGSFQLRHMPGFQRGGKVPERAEEAIAKYGQEVFNPKSPHFVGWGYQGGGPVQKLQGGGGVKGIWAGTSIDKTYASSDGISTGEVLPGYVIKALAEWAGLPGVTMFQITEGESTGHPGMDIPDPPGRSRGLYAINDHYNPQFGATAMRNPILNTLAAKKIADAAGGPNSGIWHGSSHVTGWDLHFQGDPTKIAKHVGGTGVDGGSAEHSFKEDVPSVFHGARTGDISFPSIPKNLPAVDREIKRWSEEATLYRKAKKAAEKANRAGVAQAIGHNLTEIEGHLRQLSSARQKLRLEKAKRAVSKALGKKLSKIAGYEQKIEGLQRDFNRAGQDAEQLVALEPQLEELPASATDAQRETAERDYVSKFSDYVNLRERPAYQTLLDRAAGWRNSILRAESFGFGKGNPSVTRMESTTEKKVYEVVSEIEAINAYTERVKADIAAFRHDHPKAKGFPEWLQKEIGRNTKNRGRLPFLRFQDHALRGSLGELRGFLFPGGAEHRLSPPTLPLEGTGSLEDKLTEVQGIHWPDQHELLPAAALAPPRVPGMFGGAIWDVQTSIEELGLKISQAANGIGGGGSGDDNSDLVSLLREIAERERKGRLTSETLSSTAADFEAIYPPFAGKFHQGGVVPGPFGQERIAVLKTQETVRTPEQEAALTGALAQRGGDGVGVGRVQVIVHGDIRSDDPDPVEVVLGDRRFRRAVQVVRPGRATQGGSRG